MRYLILNEKEIKPEQYVNIAETADSRLHYNEIFSLMHFACVEVSENIFQVISKEWEHKYKEVTKKQALNGSNFFSEVRPFGKVMATVNQQGVAQAWTPAGGILKVPVELTDEIRKEITDFMSIFAVEIVDDEFNVRIKNLKDTTELETASWEIQKHEAREWLREKGKNGSKTPFLDYLATERSLDKTDLSNKILTKSEAYEDKLSTMLVTYQKLKKKFEDADSVWDLNTLYEDHIGIMMPQFQAIEMGRTKSDTDWDRKPEYEVDAYVFKF